MKRAYSDRYTTTPAMILERHLAAYSTDRSKSFFAKIDTGADLTVVPEGAVQSLRLTAYGRRTVHAVNHSPYVAPTYRVDLVLDGTVFQAVEVVTHSRPYVLLGRDLLNGMVLVADGPAQRFELKMNRR